MGSYRLDTLYRSMAASLCLTEGEKGRDGRDKSLSPGAVHPRLSQQGTITESWVDEQEIEGHVPAVSFAVGAIGSVGPVEAIGCVAQLDFPTADVKKHGRLGAIEPLVILEACSALFLCELVGARVLAYRSCNCPTQTERTDHKVKQTSRSAYKDGQKTKSTFSQEKR